MNNEDPSLLDECYDRTTLDNLKSIFDMAKKKIDVAQGEEGHCLELPYSRQTLFTCKFSFLNELTKNLILISKWAPLMDSSMTKDTCRQTKSAVDEKSSTQKEQFTDASNTFFPLKPMSK